MIDLTVTSLATPGGPLWLAGTERGVSRLGFGTPPPVPDHRPLTRQRVLRIGRGPGPLRPVLGWLRAYFRGAIFDPPPPVHLSGAPAFTCRVLDVVRSLEPGQLLAFDDVARRVSSPAGARAVGRVLAQNPVPILVPCHRVTTKAGRPVAYAGGARWKRFLLDLETAQLSLALPRRRRGRRPA